MPAFSLQSMLIWAVTVLLQVFCVFLLYRRKLLKTFRYFASFFVFMTLQSVILFLCYRFSSPQSWAYFSLYWVTTAMADMFIIAVLYEIFCAAFKPFAGLQDLAKVVFKWAAASIFLVGFLVFVSAVPTPQAYKFKWLITGVFDFERIVRVMECALLMFLFMGSNHLGVAKRNRVFGFALGFGVNAFFQLIVYSGAISSHVSGLNIWAQMVPLAYTTSLLIWVGYLLQPDPAKESLHIPLSSPLLRWNEVALALGHSGGQVALNMPPEPFMPNVERMVEQVMQKEAVERRQSRVF